MIIHRTLVQTRLSHSFYSVCECDRIEVWCLTWSFSMPLGLLVPWQAKAPCGFLSTSAKVGDVGKLNS